MAGGKRREIRLGRGPSHFAIKSLTSDGAERTLRTVRGAAAGVMAAHAATRFSLLLLEPGEIYFDDFSAALYRYG